MYFVLLLWMVANAAVDRFRLPQIPFVDGDYWGYLNPAISALTGHSFQHTFGRDSLYPGFLWVLLKASGDFRAISVAQHLLGLATGILMLVAYQRGCGLLRHPAGKPRGILAWLGLLPATVYLTAPSALHFEHTVRPEAIFPLFAVLSICLNLEFIRQRWLARASRSAAWLGALQLVVSVMTYKLKPSFGFALVFVNLPLLVSLALRGMSVRRKVWMAGGGAAFCVLFLILPESLLKRKDQLAPLFLPDTLLTVHADLIRDQIADDVARNQFGPFPAETVRALLGRLDTTLALSRKPENSPYPSLGFNPDYLLYIDPVYKGVTRWSRAGREERAAMGMYYYRRTFLHRPAAMLGRIGQQLGIFYHFGPTDGQDLFTYDWHMKGTRLLALQRDYQLSLDTCCRPTVWYKQLVAYPPAQTFVDATERLTQRTLSIEQKPILTLAQKCFEILHLPGLMAALFILGWVGWTRRSYRDWLLPVAATLLLFSYNLGNNLTIAIVHSLDITRYIDNQLVYTLLASAFGILLVGETLRRAAGGLVAAPTETTTSRTWMTPPASAPMLPGPSADLPPPSLCVLIPCYNEITSIAAVVAEYHAVFPEARLLVVDNASTDGTAAAAAAAGADVLFEAGKGKARAVLTALSHIDSDLVLMVDGDGSYPAEGGRRLFESYRGQPADLITGIRNRDESADGSFRPFHQGGTHLFGRIMGLVFGWQAADLFSGLRLFSRRFYENVPILSRGFELELEVTVQAIDKGFSMRELPVPFGLRAEGTQSKLRTVQDGSRILRLLFVLFRDYRPLMCFSSVAGVFFLLSLLAGFAPIRDYVTTRYVSHLPLAVLAASLMILAFLCLQTGFVLESGLRHSREATQLRIRDSARRRRQ